jgi:hypothetical protein
MYIVQRQVITSGTHGERGGGQFLGLDSAHVFDEPGDSGGSVVRMQPLGA